MNRCSARCLLALFGTLLVMAAQGHAQEPIGTIVGWHVDFPGTPLTAPGWTPCAGMLHVEPGSPFHNVFIEDLNGSTSPNHRRFLRGAPLAGLLQEDALQGHAHSSSHRGTDGSLYGICPALFEAGCCTVITWRRDSITIGDPISDGVHGTPRLDVETRPTNMSVQWILKTGAGELPLGSIVAWHRDHPSLAGLALPAGWAPCDGSFLDDPGSPYHGRQLPELNTSGRFLRGDDTTGLLEEDALQRHGHGVTHDLQRLAATGTTYVARSGGTASPTVPSTLSIGDPSDDGANGAPRVAGETRPTNMSVLWILKTRASAPLPAGAILGWYDVAAASLPPLSTSAPGWYACDGQTVDDPLSPFFGAVLPGLNGNGRFLRGGLDSGILQADAFQGHWHDVSHDTFHGAVTLVPGSAYWGGCGSDFNKGSLSVGNVTGARTANETRPDNMSVTWIMYLPMGRGLHHQAPAPRKR